MKVATSLEKFQPWGPAKEKFEKIQLANKLPQLESYLEDMGYGGDEMIMNDVTLNDLLATEFDEICEQIGLVESMHEDEEPVEEAEEAETDSEQKIDIELEVKDDSVEVEANIDNVEFEGELQPEGTLEEAPEEEIQYDELDNLFNQAEEE